MGERGWVSSGIQGTLRIGEGNPYNELKMLDGGEAQGAQTHARGYIFYQWDTRGGGGGNHLCEVIINMQGLHLNKVLI